MLQISTCELCKGEPDSSSQGLVRVMKWSFCIRAGHEFRLRSLSHEGMSLCRLLRFLQIRRLKDKLVNADWAARPLCEYIKARCWVCELIRGQKWAGLNELWHRSERFIIPHWSKLDHHSLMKQPPLNAAGGAPFWICTDNHIKNMTHSCWNIPH